MSDDLETLYKVLTREQTTGYSGSSVLGDFEEFIAGWCNKILSQYNHQQVQKVLHDMRSMAEGYRVAAPTIRERKTAEMSRMLLSLRDILQQLPRHRIYIDNLDKPESHKDRGLAHKQEGRLSEAIAEFEKELESKPDDAFVMSHLAHIYLLLDKVEESSRLIDISLKLDPGNPFAHGVKGEILFKEGNMEEAAIVFEEILNLKSDDTYAHSKLGVIYRKQGRMKEAESVLERGLEINPEDPALHHALGDVYAWLGKDENALAEYQRAVDLDPEDQYAFRGLVSSKTRGRDIKTMISQLQKILKIPSRRQNAHLHALLAQHLKQDKQYEAAAEELREAVRLQPRSLYFQIQLAFCYSKLNQYPRVIELLEPAYRVRPRDPLIAEALAKAYTGEGRIEDARKLLIDILYIYPNNRSLRAALMKLKKPKPSQPLTEQNKS